MTEEESVSDSFVESIIRVLMKVIFVFEPLAPRAITILVNQQMHRFKDKGLIEDYRTKTKRLGKFHYRIEINSELTGMQATHLLGNLFPKRLKRFRRWFND